MAIDVKDAAGSTQTLKTTLASSVHTPHHIVEDGGGSITVDASSLPLPTGAATETTLGTRVSETNFDSKVGALTETAPATDTASSGLNGRLQRIAQRLTSLIGLLPSALTGSGNFKVALNESAVAVAVTDNSGSLTVDGAVSVSNFPATQNVADGGGSLTVDGTVAVSSVSGVVDVTPASPAANDYLPVRLTDGTGFVSVGGGTQYDEDAASAGGEKLTLAGAIRQDAPSGTTSADGDYANLKTDNVGRLWVNASGAAVPITDNSGSLTVDNAGTFATQENGAALTALQLLDDVVFTDDAAFTPATSKVAMIGAQLDDTTPDSVDEGDAGALRMSANRNLYVRIRDNAGNERGLNIDAAGALAATVTNATAANLNAAVVGSVAHDGVDAGNPVKVGGIARSSEQTAVANADRVNAAYDLVGKQIVLPYANPENMVSGTASATGTADTAVIAAGGAGVRNYITSIFINNSSATNTFVNLKDGTTIVAVIPAPANSGAVIALPVPLRGTANTAFNFASAAGVTTMNVSAVGYRGV